MTPQERIGERLRNARGERSVTEVAAALKVSVPTIYRWESGAMTPRVEWQEEIAEVYGAPWADLFAPMAVA